MMRMGAAGLPKPGKETWGPRKQGNLEYFKRAVELFREEQRRNPNDTVSIDVHHETGTIGFNYAKRSLLWESILHRADELMNRRRLEQIKKFFGKR